MEMFQHLALGFSVAFSPENLVFCFIGALMGTLIGVLPGLGPTATIAILLPITFTMEPSSALIMLSGIYYGAQYGGSTTAILVNLPGEASAAVTAIDGYRMALKGRAGSALAIAAIGSFFAGCVATLLVAVCSPILIIVARSFSSVEYTALILLGLICSIALARGSVLKSLGMVTMGLCLGTVGLDVYTGEARFTLGIVELSEGFSVVAISVGMFGLAEIFRNLQESEKSDGQVRVNQIGSLLPSKEEFLKSALPILRGTGIGAVLGVLPGGGAMLSSFASYTVEKRFSKTPGQFGHGAIEGVAGPEAANNAGAQTSFIPMLTLGIPSNPVMALMIGALIIQGIVPGPRVIINHPDIFWGVIAAMWIGNAMLIVLNLPLVGLWVKLVQVRYAILFPAIVAFCVIGSFSLNNSTFDLYPLLFFGLAGYLFWCLDCEPAPLLLGFILGPLLEEHFRRAMIIARGDITIFALHPISAVLLSITCIMLLVIVSPAIKKRRNEIFVDE